MSIVIDPGAELGDPAWVLTRTVRAQGLGQPDGAWAWQLSPNRILSVSANAVMQQDSLMAQVGVQYPVQITVNPDGAGNSTLSVVIDGTQFGPYLLSDFPAGWSVQDLGTVTIQNANPSINIIGNKPSGSGTNVWLVDDVNVGIVGSGMAVMLMERAVRSVLAQLQATLNAEIAFVKSEANLGFDLPAVTGYRCYRPEAPTPDVAEAEVYEIGDLTSPDWKYDQSGFAAGGRTRVLSSLPMRAAINHANRGDADNSNATLFANQMASRSRLYAAALVRTFRNAPDCGQGTQLLIVPGAVRVYASEPDLRRVGRAEFDFTARLQESSANETTSGGASLPTATLETP
jgi:hypothetical protein